MSDKEHTEGCWCGEWHDPEKFAVECTAPAPQPATEEMAKEYLRRMGIPNEPLLFLPEKDIYTAELLVGFAASVGSLAATPQVTPTPLTPKGIVSACSQTLAFQWLTDNGYPTAAMSQKRGYTAFQLAPILEAYWNWRKPSLDPKGD